MWNKKTTLFLVCAALFAVTELPLEAQYQNRKDSSSTSGKKQKQNASKRQKKSGSAGFASQSYAGAFDPRKPSFTLDRYNKVVTDIRKQLLTAKFTEKLDDKAEKFDFWNKNQCYRLVFYFRKIANNPEVPEVTGIHPDWLKQYAALLRNFDILNRRVRYALAKKDGSLYKQYIGEFKAHQKKCLDFLRTRPKRLTPAQRSLIRQKNIQSRIKQYQARLKRSRAVSASGKSAAATPGAAKKTQVK